MPTVFDRTKDEVAKDLIDWHFRVDPELQTIYWIRSEHDEPIMLLEVRRGPSPYTDRIDAFFFDPAGDIPYPSVVAEVSFTQLALVQAGVLPLPEGWSLEGATKIERNEVAMASTEAAR